MSIALPCLLLALALTLIAGCVSGPESTGAGSTERAEIEAWHADRVQRLREEDGWLTVVGLHWLDEGVNPVGRGAGHVVANDAFPVDDVGLITVRVAEVTFRPAAGVTVGGQPADGVLATDADGAPTVLSVGTCRFYVMQRGERLGVRIRDTAAPLRSSFAGIDRFEVDSGWRIVADFDRITGIAVPVASIIGTVTDSEIAGRATFDRDGVTCRMILMPGDTPDRFFVVFGDTTNGEATYGGGRFLMAELAGDGAHVVLDFNRAYNPPCAFTPYATCPLPVDDNRLPFGIPAGEKRWAGGH